MLGSLSVSMVLLDNLVHHGGKSSVGIVRSSIDTNSGVSVLSTGENGGLE